MKIHFETDYLILTFSRVYLENIKVADKIVRETELLIRDFYKDNETSFIFTSDHGMTDWGLKYLFFL